MKNTLVFLIVLVFSVASIFLVNSNLIVLISGFATGLWFSIAYNREWSYNLDDENSEWTINHDSHWNNF